MTVVGQLAKNRFTAGQTPLLPYLLQPPAGAPFYITNKTLTELQMALSGRASVLKVRERNSGLTSATEQPFMCSYIGVLLVQLAVLYMCYFLSQ